LERIWLMMKKTPKGYIEVCLTTQDGIQHLRCHGWLKRDKYLIKSEQVFGKGAEDFGMFIVVMSNDDLYDVIELQGDMFDSFEVLAKEDERWGTYKKLKDKDFIENISTFMFSLSPESQIDIDVFIEKANEATLDMFKNSADFMSDYLESDFMHAEEKIKDLEYLIGFFEEKERYEDCGFLLRLKDKISINEKLKPN
jgi:hypothetical protein